MSSTSQLMIGSARRVDVALSGGGYLASLQAGDPAGRPVLLLPGYTGSKEDFGPLLDPLADAGLHPIALDLPGQLDSPGPAAPAEYTPQRLARVIVEVAAALGRPVQLLGHSFGGLVARAAVLAEPAPFASLVLLCSGPAAIGGRRRADMDALDPVLETAGLPAVYAAMQQGWQADPAWAPPPPDVAAFLEHRFLSGSPAMLRGMGDAIRAERDRVAELAGVPLPILVARGADDDAWPPAVQRDMADRLGAQYIVIPEAAHSPAVENPTGTLATLLAFWSCADGRERA
jgi:pimeloyl-ACP methyl ester carboxylesterase